MYVARRRAAKFKHPSIRRRHGRTAATCKNPRGTRNEAHQRWRVNRARCDVSNLIYRVRRHRPVTKRVRRRTRVAVGLRSARMHRARAEETSEARSTVILSG